MKNYVNYYLTKGLRLNHLLVDYFDKLPIWFYKGFSNWLYFLSKCDDQKVSDSEIKKRFNRFVFGNSEDKPALLIGTVNSLDVYIRQRLLDFLDEIGVKNI